MSKRLVILVCVFVVATLSTAKAVEPLLLDDFESYAMTPQLQEVWGSDKTTQGHGPQPELETTIKYAGSKSMKVTSPDGANWYTWVGYDFSPDKTGYDIDAYSGIEIMARGDAGNYSAEDGGVIQVQIIDIHGQKLTTKMADPQSESWEKLTIPNPEPGEYTGPPWWGVAWTLQVGIVGKDKLGVAYFDDVTLVPEPATMVLLGLGGLGALIRRRR